MEARGSEIQHHPPLHSKFKPSLGHSRPPLSHTAEADDGRSGCKGWGTHMATPPFFVGTFGTFRHSRTLYRTLRSQWPELWSYSLGHCDADRQKCDVQLDQTVMLSRQRMLFAGLGGPLGVSAVLSLENRHLHLTVHWADVSTALGLGSFPLCCLITWKTNLLSWKFYWTSRFFFPNKLHLCKDQ